MTNETNTQNEVTDNRDAQVVKNKRYSVEDRETGVNIKDADTIEEAKKILLEFEEEDKDQGNYTEDFYSVRDRKTDEIIDIEDIETIEYEVYNESVVALSKQTSRSINSNSKTGWNYKLCNEEDEELVNVSWNENYDGEIVYTIQEDGCDDRKIIDNEKNQIEMQQLEEKVDNLENQYYEGQLYDHENMSEDEFKNEVENIGCEETGVDEDPIRKKNRNGYGIEYTDWEVYYKATYKVPKNKVEEFEKLCEKYNIEYEN